MNSLKSIINLFARRKSAVKKEDFVTLEMWCNGRLVFGLYGGGSSFVSGDAKVLRAARERLAEAARKLEGLTEGK